MFLKEEVNATCARPHSGNRLSVINEVDKDSTEEEEDNKRNKTSNEAANHNEEASIGGSGFPVPSPDNSCQSDIGSVIGGGL
jgi:hypothetical protein